jgi:hypothetical protein
MSDLFEAGRRSGYFQGYNDAVIKMIEVVAGQTIIFKDVDAIFSAGRASEIYVQPSQPQVLSAEWRDDCCEKPADANSDIPAETWEPGRAEGS